MRRCRRAMPIWVVAAAMLTVDGSGAQDRVEISGAIDLRAVHSDSTQSYLDGGLGRVRFDSQHQGLELGRAFAVVKLRFTDTLTLNAVADSYGDGDRNPIDLSEAWMELRPYPNNALRWRLRVGAFHSPVSLEHRGNGWTDVYSLTPSALNTWLGEEFRTIGGEVEARWLGASSGYAGDFALVAAVYGRNDPAGELLATRGFALSDRVSSLWGGLGRPRIEFFHEIDRRPGYYTGLSWRHHDRLELRLLHYDNRADPGACSTADCAWRTRYSSVGARLEPDARWTFIAQALGGDTFVGPDSAGPQQFKMNYHAEFMLVSAEAGRNRFTARFDDFKTHQLRGFFGPPSDDRGHAWTVSWLIEIDHHWQLGAECLRVQSRFPPRVSLGTPASVTENQIQAAARYHFVL